MLQQRAMAAQKAVRRAIRVGTSVVDGNDRLHAFQSTLALLVPSVSSHTLASSFRRHFSSFNFNNTNNNSSSSLRQQIRLQQLESDADAHPNDSFKQYKLLKEYNATSHPTRVVTRVESGRYAMNAGVKMEYARAQEMIRQGITSPAAMQQQSQYATTPSYGSRYTSPSAAAAASSPPNSASAFVNPWLGTKAQPLVVRQVFPRIPWTESLLHAVLYAALVTGGITALYVLFQWKFGSKNGNRIGPFNFNPFGPPKDFLNRTMSRTTFSDVKGCDEAKAELQEVVEFLRNPAKFERLGGKMTKGILLTGPPGTGKTLLAKAVAGEAGVPFFAASGSDFDEIFVGVGASRIRDLFAAARKQKRAIIFIDEIDAVGGSRDRVRESYNRATINALLTEMDGFAENSGIIVIGATNHEKVLDSALVRPGRFDKTVAVPLPDAQGRYEILQLYAHKMKLHPEVNLRLLSQATSGMTGADLYNLLNGAAIRASAAGKSFIDHDEIEYAYDKVLMGAERQFTQSLEVKRTTAYHEAGHTIMLLHTPGSPPLHKVTVLPRGRALGAMFHLPLNEHRIRTRSQMLADIDVAMGGRVAEELLNGKEHITSGASNDLEKASAEARMMVTRLGMGKSIGVLTLTELDSRSDANPHQIVSPSTLEEMDREVKDILSESYERAKQVLTTYAVEWHRLAEALLEHEVLDAKQVAQAIAGMPVTKKEVRKFRKEEKNKDETSAPKDKSEKGQGGQGVTAEKGVTIAPTPAPVPVPSATTHRGSA